MTCTSKKGCCVCQNQEQEEERTPASEQARVTKGMPWWRKDRYGCPIVTHKGAPIFSLLCIICQNLRKLKKPKVSITGGRMVLENRVSRVVRDGQSFTRDIACDLMKDLIKDGHQANVCLMSRHTGQHAFAKWDHFLYPNDETLKLRDRTIKEGMEAFNGMSLFGCEVILHDQKFTAFAQLTDDEIQNIKYEFRVS